MINAAVIVNDKVENIIYICEATKNAFIEKGMELLDVSPLGLVIGDYRENGSWYRNVNGVKTELPIVEPNFYEYYLEITKAINN